MSESIVIALITGGLAFFGTCLTCWVTSRKSKHQMEINQKITETELKELTREVREHNGFAHKIPVLEEKLNALNATVNELKSYHRS